jgi:hypothetical protein
MKFKMLCVLGLVLAFNMVYAATRVVMCEEYYMAT